MAASLDSSAVADFEKHMPFAIPGPIIQHSVNNNSTSSSHIRIILILIVVILTMTI